jgi:hypothetical protein
MGLLICSVSLFFLRFLIPITQFAGSWQPLRAAQGEEAQSPLALGDGKANDSA